MAISIPHDVLFYRILPTLPIKTVGRFKCVSKELHSFLSSNEFTKMHIRHIDYDHQNHGKFLAISMDRDEYYRAKPVMLSTLDCEAADHTLTPTPFSQPKAYKITFLTSFHGLVCLHVIKENSDGWYMYRTRNYSRLILWNPLTSDYKILSRPKSNKIWESAFGLFFSSCEDDYKLVSVISHNKVLIYSLKSDSWRRIVFQVKSDLNIDSLSQGTSLKEDLYFLNDSKYYSVVKFDTKTETLAEMKVTPALNIVGNTYRSTLMVKKGHIHVCIMYDTMKFGYKITSIELWKIKKVGNWKMMVTYHIDSYQIDQRMKPLHLTRNGNLLLRGHTYDNIDYLYNVDLNKNKLNMQKPCKGIGKGKELLPVANTRISEIVRYIETFVSPNQYSK